MLVNLPFRVQGSDRLYRFLMVRPNRSSAGIFFGSPDASRQIAEVVARHSKPIPVKCQARLSIVKVKNSRRTHFRNPPLAFASA